MSSPTVSGGSMPVILRRSFALGWERRKMGVSVNTMQRWRAKFGGMTVSEAQEKRRLEDENRRLRQLVSQFALEVDALKAALGKRW